MRDDEPRPVWMSLPITEVCVVGPIKRVCVYYCSTCYKAVFLLLKYRVFFTCLLQCLLLTKLHDVFIVHSTADLFKRVRVGGNLFVFRIFQPVRVGNPVREGRARFGKSQKLSGAVNYYPEISVREFETNWKQTKRVNLWF